jgi:hypothetical protein
MSLVAIMVVGFASFAGAADIAEITAEKGDQNPQTEGLTGSVLVVESVDDTDPANVVIALTGENTSTDMEYWDRVTVELPAAWSIVSLDAEEIEATSFYEFPTMAGVGTNVGTWYKSDAPCSNLGFLRSSDTQDHARFILTVNTNGVGGTVDVVFMIEGDSWGADPHVICSASSPCSFDGCYGMITPATATDLSVTVAVAQPTPTPTPVEAIPTNTNMGLVVLIGILMAAGAILILRRS